MGVVTDLQQSSVRNKNLNCKKRGHLATLECSRRTIHIFRKKRTNPLKRGRMIALPRLLL